MGSSSGNALIDFVDSSEILREQLLCAVCPPLPSSLWLVVLDYYYSGHFGLTWRQTR